MAVNERKLVALIIILLALMVVKVYKSTRQNSLVASSLSYVYFIAAVIDQLAPTGDYSGVTTAALKVTMGLAANTTPWGGDFELIALPNPSSYNVALYNVPNILCNILRNKIIFDSHYLVVYPEQNALCDTPVGRLMYNYTRITNAPLY